jgi:hypothetical protein
MGCGNMSIWSDLIFEKNRDDEGCRMRDAGCGMQDAVVHMAGFGELLEILELFDLQISMDEVRSRGE